MTESTRKLAEEIVKSWHGTAINYIIVAPPMSAPERLFELLENADFLESKLGDVAPKMAVARLARTSFSSEEKFVSAMAKQWKIPLDNDLGPTHQLGHLARKVIQNGRLPILLVERFHEAMERLGEDFGAALRDLDKALEIRTVVELPISFTLLKLRWDANPGKAPFLNSDWGQGHLGKVLKGYSRQEIATQVAEHGGTTEAASFLFAATGGLPKLVEPLIGRVGEMDLRSYEFWVRSRTREGLCQRLIDWLDYPGGLTYTRLVAQSLSTAHPRNGPISLANHPWKTIIQGPDGKTSCMVLAWASLDRLAEEHDAKYVASLTAATEEGRIKEAATQLAVLANDANPNWETWRALELLCRFQDAADPYTPECWNAAAKHLADLKSLAEHTENVQVRSITQLLGKWDALTQLISEYLKGKQTRPKETLEQFVCTKPDKVKAFLELLNLRLKRASQLTPYHALTAVIAQPESLFQIYSQLKLDICCWNYSGMCETDASRIRGILRKPYTAPKNGQSLGFFDMLCLNLVKCDAIPNHERLVLNETEFNRFERLYKVRSDQVHNTAFVSPSDWEEYRNYCRELLGRLANVLIGTNESIDLPEPMECFSQLAGSLVSTGASKY